MFLPQQEDDQVHAHDSGRFAERVLLVGWDGAQWPVLRSLLEQGRLPHLASLLNLGACGELLCPRPIVAPSVWTSLATGKRPHEHGILHSSCPTQDGLDIGPITRRSRRSPAVWNILSRAGLRTHVVGWPITHPAEKVVGICVSEWFAVQFARAVLNQPEGPTVFPPEAESQLRARRVTPQRVEEMALAQVLPQQAIGSPQHEQLTAVCRGLLAEAATTFRAVRWCLSNEPWDFAACVFPAIRLCHELVGWLHSVAGPDAEISQYLVNGCYEHHDLLLGQLLQQVGDDTHIVAVSPSGPAISSTGSAEESDESRTLAAPPRDSGFIAIRGPKVRHVVFSARRSVLDVVPTLLAMFGVPYGKDMEGRPWLDVLEVDLEPGVVDTCNDEADNETASGPPASAHSSGEGATSRGTPEQSVQYLLELGYVDPEEQAGKESADRCRRETELNKAISQLDAGLVSPAISTLEQLSQEHRHWLRPHEQLAEAYYRANMLPVARQEIDWLMCRGDEKPQLYFLLGAIDFAERQFDLAIEQLRCAGRAGTSLPGLHGLEGSTHLHRRDFAAAETAFQSALDFDGPSPRAHDGLAVVYLHLGRYEDAALNALAALDTEMRYGMAHYHLGVALLHLDKPSEALRAFESWAAIEPERPAPYRWLAHVCQKHLDDSPRAATYRRRGREVVRRRREIARQRRAGDTSAPSSGP